MSHSSIEVNASTAAFFSAITGMPWPKIREGELRDVRDAYEHFAAEMPELREQISKVAVACLHRGEGAAMEAFAEQLKSFIGGTGGDDYVTAAGSTAKKLADCAGDVANAVEYTKWMAIAQLVQLMVEIALAVFWAPFTFGASLSGLVLRKLLTKVALQALMKYLIKTILMHTFSGLVGGLVMDGIIQGVQIGQGNRKEVDKEYTKQAALFGLIGGVLSGPLDLLGLGLGKLLGRLIGRSGGRLLADQLSDYLVHGDLQGLKGLLKTAAEAAEKEGGKGSLGALSKKVLAASEKELAGLPFTKKEAKALARDLGNLLDAAAEQLRHGFGPTGRGTLSEIFVHDMGKVFADHLGSSLGGREAAGLIGREFGEAFTRNWLGAAERSALKDAAGTGVKDALGTVLTGAELKATGLKAAGLSARHVEMLGTHLPDLAEGITGGNRAYHLGTVLGGYLQSGVQNVLTEGFYNLIFGENHEFTVSAGSFLGGVLTGAMGHVLHVGASPLMHRYQTWVHETQHAAVQDGASEYFPLHHPISFAALASLASGKVVPFPVPRMGHPGAYQVSKLHGGTLEDYAEAIGHASGKPVTTPEADAEVAEWMQSMLTYADFLAGEGPVAPNPEQLTEHLKETARKTPTVGGEQPLPKVPAPPVPPKTPTESRQPVLEPHVQVEPQRQEQQHVEQQQQEQQHVEQQHVEQQQQEQQQHVEQQQQPPVVPESQQHTQQHTPAGESPTVLGTREIRPPVNEFARNQAARAFESFQATKLKLPDGDTETLLTLRVHLDTRHLDPAAPDTAQALEALKQRARKGVADAYDLGQRLPNGDRLRVEVEFVDDPADAHHTATVHPEQRREDLRNWSLHSDATTLAHELGHAMGLADEYREAGGGPRPVYPDAGLMGTWYFDKEGNPLLDADRTGLGSGGKAPSSVLKARNLRQLGATVDAAFGPAPSPHPDLPARARFDEDTRRRALYGGPSGGGHLYAPAGSGRDRPAPVPGSTHRNGTYRVVGGPADQFRPRPDDPAGDLAGVRHRTVFPEHWTEDDAVYAAEQAYQHALRTGRITETGPYSYHWEGEYGGVRIEGEVRAGEFTSFRPSDRQHDLETPAHLLPRPLGQPFDLRGDDLLQYGDRHTMTGVHHAPTAAAAAAAAHGIKVEPTGQPPHENGTYRADVWYLDPKVAPGAPLSHHDTRWHRPAGEPPHTMYPAHWTLAEVHAAVEEAYRNRRDPRPPGPGAEHWVGEARGVRIEGLTRDGRHLVHRPTDQQPSARWRQDDVAELTPPVEHPHGDGTVTVRHARFADGQQGVELATTLHLAFDPAVRGRAREEYRQALQRALDEHTAGDPPVRLRVDLTDTPAPGRRSATVTRDAAGRAPDLAALLPDLLGEGARPPRELALDLAAATPATGWQPHGTPRPAGAPLREPVTPGTGPRPPATSRLTSGEQALLDQVFAPVLAPGAGRGLPPEWTPLEARRAVVDAVPITTRTDPDTGLRYTVADHHGLTVEYRTENGLIVDYRAAAGQTPPDQYRVTPPTGPAVEPPHAPVPPPQPEPSLFMDPDGLWHRPRHPDGSTAGLLRPRTDPHRPAPTVEPNGTVRVHDWTLRPGIRPDSPLARFPSNWRRPAHDQGHVHYPTAWSPAHAHDRAREAAAHPLRQVQLPDERRYFVGESGGVRIEGHTDRDGNLLTHRATPDQPPAPHPPATDPAAPPRRSGYLLTGRPPATPPPGTHWTTGTDQGHPHRLHWSPTATGRDLPPGWTPEQGRFAVDRILADALADGVVPPATGPAVLRGEHAGVLIDIALQDGAVTGYRAVAGRGRPPRPGRCRV
ncbi:EndoU domain-containing protein [Kitasatospora phosalacinea]|uniref:EndoU domain-containing protein n=1 Tax=Kitasatospora phosalacinea TaxID=2065 RepID=UPI0036596BC8